MIIQIIWGLAVIGIVFYYALVLAKTKQSRYFRLSISLLQIFWAIPMVIIPNLHNNHLFYYLLPSLILLLPWIIKVTKS
jgi:hypothetical protein